MVSLISNPVSGKYSIEQKYNLLLPIAKYLKSEIHGLDTITKEEFKNCIKDLSSRHAEICVAGGDGTILDVLNSIERNTIISYIPLGSGNALKSAFNLPSISNKKYDKILNHIITGRINYVDSINCNEIYTFFAGIGIDALIAFKREKMIRKGIKGFSSFSKAFFDVLKQGFPKYSIDISLDDHCFKTEASTLIVSKITHFGYNLQIMPEVCIDDSLLHLRTIPSGHLETTKCLLTGFLQNQRVGTHYSGKTLSIKTKLPIYVHLNGTPFKPTDELQISVAPKSFKFRY